MLHLSASLCGGERVNRCSDADQNFDVMLQEVLRKFNLQKEGGSEPQTYALGLKEVWEVSHL